MSRIPGYRGTGAPTLRALVFSVPLCFGASVSGCKRPTIDHARIQTAADSADHVMMGMKVVVTSAGVRQANVEADTALVYESAGRTQVKVTKLTFFTPAGVQQSVLTADSGWYDVRTGNMEALGHVLVVRSDGARLNTARLLYEPAKNQVSSDQFYTYSSGEQHGQGTGFTSDPSFSNVLTHRLRGAGGGFALPGQ